MEKACHKDAPHSLLIWTTSRVVEFTNSKHEMIASSLSLTQAEVSSVCAVTKKCFVSNLGQEGTVLSSGNSPLWKLWEAWKLILLLRASGIIWVHMENLQMCRQCIKSWYNTSEISLRMQNSVNCCVPGCTNNFWNNPGIKYYRIPKDEKLRRGCEILIRNATLKVE